MYPGSVLGSAVVAGVAVVVIALAATEDLLRQRIPNVLNASALAVGLFLGSWAGGWSGLIWSVCGALVGCAALIPFYLLRGMGAGDVKLMAALGSFLGPSGALLAAALALVAGLVMALSIVAWRLVESRPTFLSTPASGDEVVSRSGKILAIGQERFPYAVAVGAGVVATLWWRGSLGGLFTALGIG